jgi:hypothetical protein
MCNEVHERLQQIEDAYYAGAKYEALAEEIVATATLIAGLDRQDPVREGAETFAPLLWGGASGSCIDPARVKTALAGSNGDSHLRSWSSIGRGLLAYRAAA